RANRVADEILVDTLIDTSNLQIKWTRDLKASLARRQYSRYDDRHLRNCIYRPFTRRYLYFDDFWNDDRYQNHLFFPTPQTETENVVICLTDVGSEKPFMVMITSCIVDLHIVG